MFGSAPLRRLFVVVNGGTPTAEPENWDGGVAWATPVDLAAVNGGHLTSTQRTLTEQGLTTGSAAVGDGCLICSTRAPIGYVAETTQRTAFNQGCRGLVPRAQLDVRFYRYVLSALEGQLQARGQGSTFVELSTESLASMPVPCPSQAQQRTIADFLDAETARIDALVLRRRRQQVVLGQRRDVEARALLVGQHAPGETALAPLKRRWRVLDCKHRTPPYTPDGYPVVSPGDVTPGLLDLSRCHRFVGEDDFRDLTDGRRPLKGDLIYSRNASIGIAAYVATDAPFTMGQDVCLITSTGQDQRYLGHVLNTLGVDQLQLLKVGSTFSRVNIAQIQELLVPDREPAEQRRLADELDRRSAAYSEALAVLDRAVELLQERKQALVTAAVTGQLNIAREIAEEAS
jgi:type I restriction enzyme S subunit